MRSLKPLVGANGETALKEGFPPQGTALAIFEALAGTPASAIFSQGETPRANEERASPEGPFAPTSFPEMSIN